LKEKDKVKRGVRGVVKSKQDEEVGREGSSV
jgi:hypothetical protein